MLTRAYRAYKGLQGLQGLEGLQGLQGLKNLQGLQEKIKILYEIQAFGDNSRFWKKETGTDRASDMKMLRLVRMCLRPYLKRQWMNPYHFCVSSKEENTNFKRNNNVSDNSGKCF